MEMRDGVSNGNIQTPEPNSRILMAAQAGNIEELRHALDADADSVNVPNSDGLSPLFLAVKEGSIQCVKLLVSRKADVNMTNKTDRIVVTGMDESWALADDEQQNQTTPLLSSPQYSLSPFLLACRLGHCSIVEFLFYNGADHRQTSLDDGLNCLSIAIMYNHEEVSTFLATHTDRDILLFLMKTLSRDLKLGRHNGRISTPMRQLIQYMPNVAEIVMDRCITVSESGDEVTCFLELLDDFYSPWAKQYKDRTADVEVFDEKGNVRVDIKTSHAKIKNDQHPLALMQEQEKHAQLLTHPLTVKLIEQKWRTMGVFLNLASLFVYLIFLFFLTGYVLINPPAFYIKFLNKTDIVWFYDPAKLLPDATYSDAAKYFFGKRSAEFIMTLVILNIVKEIFQLYSQRRSYFTFQSLLEWSIYVLTFFLVLPISGANYDGYELREKWQWQCGALAIFLAWINLTLYIRQTLTFGIYVIMFQVVFRSTILFMVVIFLFMVAFALAFNTLLLNQTDFHSFGDSLLTTFAMSTGELGFTRIFHQQDYLDYNNESPQEAYILTSIFSDNITSITFVVFVIAMPIIAMNLLVGVAVEDIHRIRQKARFYYLKLKVDHVISAENMVLGTSLGQYFIKRIPITVQFLKIRLSRKPRLRTRLTKVVHFEEFRDSVREVCKRNQEREQVRSQRASMSQVDEPDGAGSVQILLQKLRRMRDEIDGIIKNIEH